MDSLSYLDNELHQSLQLYMQIPEPLPEVCPICYFPQNKSELADEDCNKHPRIQL